MAIPIGRVGFVLKGTWNSETSYSPLDVVYRNGATYAAVVSTTGDDPELSSESWQLFAVGGQQGPQGEQGPQGDPGIQGPTGATPELSIGTVSTLDPGESATVTITGTDEEPVLNFGIPAGDIGETGETGATPNLTIGTVQTLATGEDAEATITGSVENPILNLGLPRGAQGIQGVQGDPGPAGPVAAFSIGTVTTLSEGSDATATITGTDAAPVLNLGIPVGATGEQGETGETGATPNLTIGTVTTVAEGGSATAAITGTAEDPVLNLGIPVGATGQTGQTGATGATPNLTIGTVSTVAEGGSATASITGTAENPVLNLGIPVGATGQTGQTGQTGATPDFSIGTVSTLSPGSSATATITGTAAAPVLNLGIPEGEKGDTGPSGLPSGGSSGDVLVNDGNGGASWAAQAITGSAVTLASGDAVVFADSSDSGKLKKADAAFDGSTTTKALSQKGTFETFLTEHQSLSAYAPLASPAFTGTPTAPTASAGTNSTQIATTAFVATAVSALEGAVYFMGSLGTGGTIDSLPAASSSNKGYAYKVITAGTYQSVVAAVGDMLISDGTSWVLIPSGDEPSGTVTSVTLKAGTGISLDVDDTAITTSGTRTITNSGVRAVSSGSTNGTISVNTGGTSAEVSVAGLGSAAYTASTAYAASDHVHGSITNGGAITATAVSAGSGDSLVLVDSSDSGKVIKSDIAIGSDTTKYLRNDGTWAVPPDTTYTAATASPIMDGTAAVGSSAKYAREDHVHPTDTGRAASDHVHGDITNGGAIMASGVALANGDALVFADSSASGKLEKASIAFDGSTDTKALTQKGTWETFLKSYAPSTTTATIATSDWNNDSATVSVTGVTSSNVVLISPAPASFGDVSASKVYCTAQGSGTLTFACDTTPTAPITMNVMIM